MTSPTYWRATDHQGVSSDEALRAWAAEAYDLLVETASHYGRVMSPGELVARVQDRAGIRSAQGSSGWLGRMLSQVIHRAQATGVPPLTSLVISPADGTVGPQYAEVLRLQGKPTANEKTREAHAAEARLACYKLWATDVPEGAKPVTAERLVRPATTVRRQSASASGRSAAASRSPRPSRSLAQKLDVPTTRICPTCFLETPLDGECQNCL